MQQMTKKAINSFQFWTLFLGVSLSINAQELGANLNHNLENLEFEYLEQSQVKWIRTTPRILDYADGKLRIENDPALSTLNEAGERGYQIALGFRWDFKSHGMAVPKPGSKEEKELFELERRILEEVGTQVDMFKLGNEINLETLDEDMKPNANGDIPILVFIKRQLEMVVIPYFESNRNGQIPPLYVGSFPRLFMEETQTNPGVRELIKFADCDDRITGLSIHLHVSSFKEVKESFEFVRRLMPSKPIIVPEFSFHRLFLKHSEDLLGDSSAGIEFAKKYQRKPSLKMYEWCEIGNSSQISSEEWEAFFNSRDWFPRNYLQTYFQYYKTYGVVLATFPIFQQSCPVKMTANSPMWFINPIFGQKNLELTKDGKFSANPLVYDDFIEIVTRKL